MRQKSKEESSLYSCQHELMEEEDRISELPDCLIIEILSCLDSTKQAIRTGALSKRWQNLWTYVPALVIRESECRIYNFSFFGSVNKTISQCRQTKLNKFKLILRSVFGYESLVKSWIHHAIRCNAEEIELNIEKRDLKGVSVLDKLFYNASSFTHLKSNLCIFNPSTAITWRNLKSLNILNAELEKDSIGNILSGSPLLETLKLNSFYGIFRLDITSKSVKKLVLSNFYGKYDDIIVINAPNLLSITIKGALLLSKLLLQNVPSLVKVKLDYKKYGFKEANEEMLKGLLLSTRHVKEVNIGIYCFMILSLLKDKGFIPPSNLKLPMNEMGFL